jgi:acylphosphatase
MSHATTVQIIFTGRVQGVGFRYTVRSIASRHPVKGYVKNLADGTVELVLQGAPEEANAVLAEVVDHFRENIAHCERRALKTQEEFTHFDIRF